MVLVAVVDGCDDDDDESDGEVIGEEERVGSGEEGRELDGEGGEEGPG